MQTDAEKKENEYEAGSLHRARSNSGPKETRLHKNQALVWLRFSPLWLLRWLLQSLIRSRALLLNQRSNTALLLHQHVSALLSSCQGGRHIKLKLLLPAQQILNMTIVDCEMIKNGAAVRKPGLTRSQPCQQVGTENKSNYIKAAPHFCPGISQNKIRPGASDISTWATNIYLIPAPRATI